MSRSDRDDVAPAGIGGMYAAFQLSKALTTHERHADAETSARAAERVRRWQQVLLHTLHGSADYGSRTPLVATPAWVTLEVVTGGFATGAVLAGGELSAHERGLAASVTGVREGHERFDLNTYFLSDAGIAELQARLDEDDYAIAVPEEAALPMVAWLLRHERADAARALIDVIAPFFARLRFHPPCRDGHDESAAEVHLVDAGDVARDLSAMRVHPRIARQQHAVGIRLPLYDEMVGLFLDTCEDGWPCRRYPAQWREHALASYARYREAQEGMDETKRSRRDRKTELWTLLGRCAQAPQALTGREVGRIRRILDDFVAKHGDPRAGAHRAARERQQRDVAAPGFHRIAHALSARLRAYPPKAGIADFSLLLAPIDRAEADGFGLPEATTIPRPLQRRLRRCRRGSIAELTACGLITSGETIARLLPRISAEIRSAGFEDPALRRLYAATYRAFRRRRSLLLLNLQHQVRLEELPWIAAIEPLRQPKRFERESAREALAETARLAIRAFPFAILPNKLLQELRALASTADLDLPLVDEVAADIFMGEFTGKFAEAARRAAVMLDGSLYARYYAIDTAAVIALPRASAVVAPRRWWQSQREDPAPGQALVDLCAQRAGVQPGRWHPATNGMVIEQQQILTTQNLAVLFSGLGLTEALRDDLPEMVRRSFEWICERQQMKIDRWHARLIMLKNTAYAWRQMLFYLSLMPEEQAQATTERIKHHFEAQTPAFRTRFQPALLGLRHVATGGSLHQDRVADDGARVFLGWSVDRHWLHLPRSG